MTRNLRTLLAADAERWIRAWSRPDVSREDAAVMVTYWHLYEPADPELVELVLARFSPAEPPAVPGLDWLPSPDEVASYTAAVAESLAVPAPVKALAAVAELDDDEPFDCAPECRCQRTQQTVRTHDLRLSGSWPVRGGEPL